MKAAEGIEVGAARRVPEVKPWVRRLLEAQQVTLDDLSLGWWSVHLEEFLRYCRRERTRAEARVSARAYFEALRRSEPPPSNLRVEQTKQALTVFLRGTANWHWEQSETGAWHPRFRIQAGRESGEDGPRSASSTAPVAASRENWERDLRAALRVRHYAIRTEQTYTHWARDFLEFHPSVSLPELSTGHVQRYLEHLALGRSVSGTTQNQALSALLFFFRHVLGRDLGELGETVRARAKRKLPIVLSRDEVRRVFAATDGTTGLILRLLYGGGLRLMECLRLRVKDVDLERQVLTVRDGKGARTAPCPYRARSRRI